MVRYRTASNAKASRIVVILSENEARSLCNRVEEEVPPRIGMARHRVRGCVGVRGL